MRANSNRTSDQTSLDALNRTIEGLEARIESLIHGAAERQRRSDVGQRGAVGAPDNGNMRNAARFDPVSEIRRRQMALDSKWENTPEPAPVRGVTPPENQYYSRSRDPYAERDLTSSFNNLRQDLRSDLSESLAREMQSLRNEIKSIRAMADHQRGTSDLSGELSRLQLSIDRLGGSRSPEAERLRMDIEDLRMAVDQMAREDSLTRLEGRWDGFEKRVEALDPSGLQNEIMALAYRLDDIKAQLGAFSDSPSIVAVEGKLIALAELVEKLGHHMQPKDQALSEQFAALDNRLDEISRAIAATSSRPLTQNIDNAIAHRIESRLNSLAEHLDTISETTSRKTAGISGTDFNQRIDALTGRIEELAKQRSVAQLEERLDQLSSLLERNQQMAVQPELSSFLNEIAHKIDTLDAGSSTNALEMRLEQLSRQIQVIDERKQAQQVPADFDLAFAKIEDRLGDIAMRLDESTHSSSSDSEALANLENQIAHLSQLISQPSYQDPGSMTAQIDNRMSAVEEQLASNDEYIIEVARQAAEAVLDTYMRNNVQHMASPQDMQMLTGLAADLRNLEDLTKSSEARSQKTFEALHDTLVQIAGRLDRLDQRTTDGTGSIGEGSSIPPLPKAMMPEAKPFVEKSDDLVPSSAIDAFLDDAPTKADAKAEEQDLSEKRGLIKSLTNRFRTTTSAPIETKEPRIKLDPAPSLDPTDALEGENELLEPGSGQPDIKQILERVRASQSNGQRRQQITPENRADIIAAARRAAAAAALESEQDEINLSKATKTGAKTDGARARFRRPLLLGIGAILLALLTIPVVKTVTTGMKAPQTAIELNAPASDVLDQNFTTSSVTVPGAIDLKAQMEADRLEEQAKSLPPAIDDRVIGGQKLPEETLGSGAKVDSFGSLAKATEDNAPITEALIDIPKSVEPASLAQAAAGGDPLALFEVASRYVEGRSGLPEDHAQAAKYYKIAADKGHAMSQYRLASMYEKAIGVKQDLSEARRYYELAANQGNAGAMHNLAVMLTSNAFGAPDFGTASQWFTKAANLGVSDSQYNLAILHARGSGVKADLEQAYKWFAIAARDGDSDAAEKRDQIGQALTTAQLDSVKANLDAWKAQPLDETANSVTLPDAWTDGAAVPTASVDMEKAIRNIQAILNKNGFDAGNADGKLGQKTVNAIKEFQTSVGMEPDGRISDKLVTELLERNK